jgi:putative transposase
VKFRKVDGRTLSAAVRRNPSGKYFVSVVCERYHCSYVPAKKKAVGIDLGLKDFAILPDGAKVKPNRFFRQYEQKLEKVQSILSRRTKEVPTGTKPNSK